MSKSKWNFFFFKEAEDIWEHRLAFGIQREIRTIQREGRFANKASDDTFLPNRKKSKLKVYFRVYPGIPWNYIFLDSP